MKESEIEKRVRRAAEDTMEFIEDRLHRYTLELSNVKSGQNTLENNKKRDFTRSIFYNKVGAGTPLSSATYDLGFYVNSTENYEHKKVKDHIMPPQLLGEFFLDKLCGYHTEKDTSIYSVEKISEFIKICFKVIELPDKSPTPAKDGKYKSMNNLISYHSCYSKQSIENPQKFIPIVISDKYKYLNENSYGVENSQVFKNNLTIMKDGRVATDDELAWLFESPEGFNEWQVEKYNALTINDGNTVKYIKQIITENKIGTLDQFLGEVA